jgi:hypothetical protein
MLAQMVIREVSAQQVMPVRLETHHQLSWLQILQTTVLSLVVLVVLVVMGELQVLPAWQEILVDRALATQEILVTQEAQAQQEILGALLAMLAMLATMVPSMLLAELVRQEIRVHLLTWARQARAACCCQTQLLDLQVIAMAQTHLLHSRAAGAVALQELKEPERARRLMLAELAGPALVELQVVAEEIHPVPQEVWVQPAAPQMQQHRQVTRVVLELLELPILQEQEPPEMVQTVQEQLMVTLDHTHQV